MHYITDAEYVGGYRLRLRFDDKTTKLVDLDSHLDGGVFEPLRDLNYFRQFRLEPDLDTVVWPNGADFCPDFLHAIGQDIGEMPGYIPSAVPLRQAS